MYKLQSLVEHLRKSSLNLPSENILSFIKNGKLVHNYDPNLGSGNRNFKMTYQGNLIITNCTVPISQLFTVITQWMYENNPWFDEDAMDYQADILNNNSYDFQLKIDLDEVIKTTPTQSGTYVNHDDQVDMDDLLFNSIKTESSEHYE